MKILFTTEAKKSASTVFNLDNLRHLNDIEGINFDSFNKNYADYDVVLFMGYDPEVEQARAANKHIKIGVIDPRSTFKNQAHNADFIVVNGIENKDWYSGTIPNIFTYYIYPVLEEKRKEHKKSDTIVIGYHGNKIHLTGMVPRISDAVNKLAENYKVEILAMYNIKDLGKWKEFAYDPARITINHIQWKQEHYEKYMSRADIGIVPGLIPVKRNPLSHFFLKTPGRTYNEHPTDYLLRFKATSNAGRLFVFAQYGIPVVADMYPSALQLIDDTVSGYVCSSTGAWYNALKLLSDSPGKRTEVAAEMAAQFHSKASIESMNQRLVTFIKNL